MRTTTKQIMASGSLLTSRRLSQASCSRLFPGLVGGDPVRSCQPSVSAQCLLGPRRARLSEGSTWTTRQLDCRRIAQSSLGSWCRQSGSLLHPTDGILSRPEVTPTGPCQCSLSRLSSIMDEQPEHCSTIRRPGLYRHPTSSEMIRYEGLLRILWNGRIARGGRRHIPRRRASRRKKSTQR
ncbi:hypothetical protein OH77DRAFT_1210359 [Trametes cingulata]|nr:hypothetical protein OH77DRAFT_1210359 [Trametes cingulata]